MLFLRGDIPSYAVEIAAALIGSLITVIITMLLLARQSESELLRERNVRLLDAKIKVYDGLIDAVKMMIRTGQIGPEQQLEIQMLNQRLSFYASTEVLGADPLRPGVRGGSSWGEGPLRERCDARPSQGQCHYSPGEDDRGPVL